MEMIKAIQSCKEESMHMLCERSMRTDALFFKVLRRQGDVSDVEWDVYNQFFDLDCSHLLKKKSVTICIDVDAKKCFERIKKRGREGEESITLDYLRDLEIAHRELFKELKDDTEKNNQLVIDLKWDMDLDVTQMKEKVTLVIQAIESFDGSYGKIIHI
jgi:deoxyadenosine/deoxycytidine kinase